MKLVAGVALGVVAANAAFDFDNFKLDGFADRIKFDLDGFGKFGDSIGNSKGTKKEACGDGKIQVKDGETCDGDKFLLGEFAPPDATFTCRDDCTYCGDGVLQSVEQCDFGLQNSNVGPGCSEDCVIIEPATCAVAGFDNAACNADPDFFEALPNPENILCPDDSDAASCTLEWCCEPQLFCSPDYTCQEPVNMLRPDAGETPCPGNVCTDAVCCVPESCDDSDVCLTDNTVRPGAFGLECDGNACDTCACCVDNTPSIPSDQCEGPWNINYSSNNGIIGPSQDCNDLGNPVINSGDTVGLCWQVNRGGGTTLGSQTVGFYLQFEILSGDYIWPASAYQNPLLIDGFDGGNGEATCTIDSTGKRLRCDILPENSALFIFSGDNSGCVGNCSPPTIFPVEPTGTATPLEVSVTITGQDGTCSVISNTQNTDGAVWFNPEPLVSIFPSN
mmetsp:Transcript_2401/g.5065  ORF Transcript_2401/g.5065 Transcript_2401/m.5065 type:complete len:447 (+) Transcript_2401:135-1475(+)